MENLLVIHLLIYALKNSGHRAIALTDWERPFAISFGNDTIVSAEIASQHPSNLNAKILIETNCINLVPLMLNPGDQIVMKMLVSSEQPITKCDMRVLDVASLSPINTSEKLPPFFQSGLPTLMYMCAAIAGIIFAVSEDTTKAIPFLIAAIFAPIFGWSSRVFQNFGSSARRRVSEL
jgi:hypothetical protein